MASNIFFGGRRRETCFELVHCHKLCLCSNSKTVVPWSYMMIGQYHSTELFLSLRSRELVFAPQALPHYWTAVPTFAQEKWQYHVQWCAKKRAAIHIVIHIVLEIYNMIWHLTAFFFVYRVFLAYSNIYRRVSMINSPYIFVLGCSWVSTAALFSLEQNVPNMLTPNPLLTLRPEGPLIFFYPRMDFFYHTFFQYICMYTVYTYCPIHSLWH